MQELSAIFSVVCTAGMEKSKAGEAYWSHALKVGVQAMTFYGGATTGMRTMLDALIPAVDCLVEGTTFYIITLQISRGFMIGECL